jgi:hypothetical protein
MARKASRARKARMARKASRDLELLQCLAS